MSNLFFLPKFLRSSRVPPPPPPTLQVTTDLYRKKIHMPLFTFPRSVQAFKKIQVPRTFEKSKTCALGEKGLKRMHVPLLGERAGANDLEAQSSKIIIRLLCVWKRKEDLYYVGFECYHHSEAEDPECRRSCIVFYFILLMLTLSMYNTVAVHACIFKRYILFLVSLYVYWRIFTCYHYWKKECVTYTLRTVPDAHNYICQDEQDVH